jgi:hypothetical protein
MKTPPLENEAQSARKKLATHATVRDSNLNLASSISRVKMRRHMVVVVHGDHDSEEPTYERHPNILAPQPIPLRLRPAEANGDQFANAAVRHHSPRICLRPSASDVDQFRARTSKSAAVS